MSINWSLKKFKVSQLKDYDKNPRQLSRIQHDHLRQSIEKFGLIDKPICTQKGHMIGGHQRKKILKSMGITEVECWVPDRELTDKEIEECCVRLNRNHGEFDFEMLANLFEPEDLMTWGFEDGEIPGIEEIDLEEPKEEKKKCNLCPKCGFDLNDR